MISGQFIIDQLKAYNLTLLFCFFLLSIKHIQDNFEIKSVSIAY